MTTPKAVKPKPKAAKAATAKRSTMAQTKAKVAAKRKPKIFQGRRLATKQIQQIRLAQAQNRPYYHPAQQCYKLGEKAMKGANKWLRDTLYPHYQYQRSSDAPVRAGPSDPGCAKGGKGGLHRGKLVDKQITLWAQAGGKYLPPARHRYALRVMAAFKKWGWTPISAQIVVVGHGLGTAIDLKVRDQDGKVFAIELKTGFYQVFDTPQGHLKPPLAFVTNTPRHHAMLQLAIGLVLYQNPHCQQGYVVRVDADGVFRYPLEEWALKAVKSLVVQHS